MLSKPAYLMRKLPKPPKKLVICKAVSYNVVSGFFAIEGVAVDRFFDRITGQKTGCKNEYPTSSTECPGLK